MIKQIVFLVLVVSMVFYGLVFTLKHFGWPSPTERKNIMLRSLRAGISSTALGVGLLLLFYYWSSPEEFWSQWTVANTIGGCLLVVFPFLGVMIGISFIQFSVWEKTQSIMTARLKKITSAATKENKKEK